MKAVRMASYADADRTVFGSAGPGNTKFPPRAAHTVPYYASLQYWNLSPPSATVWAPFSWNAGKILRRRARLQRGKFGILPFPAFFQKRLHASGVFPFFPRRGTRGEFLHTLHFFRLVPGPCFQQLVFFRLDIIPARNRINGKLRHPVFHGLGKRPSGSGSSSTGVSSSCLRASSSRSRRSSSSLLLFSRSSRSACS